MTEPVNAMIRWVPAERGGRKAPPAGPVYRTVARFEDARDRWPEEAWSLVVELVRPYRAGGDAAWAKVRFLVDEAPAELLSEGARFELCEGRRVVGKGVVLPSKVQPPQELDSFAMALLG
jgi:hypothetical protein